MLRPPTSQTAASLFAHYELDTSFDEMFAPGHKPRDAYRLLFDRLLELPAAEWRHRQQAADRAFLNQGMTFTVYGNDEGTERIFPYDLLPRIITGAEWSVVERGLTQRLLALNLFLKDIYHEGKILADGVVPRELVYSCPHYRREMCGVRVPPRRLRVGRGHRPGPRRGRRLRGARGQPARAERRVLHAGQPAGDEAGLPAASSRATASARSITTASSCSARCGRWRRAAERPDHRRAHARRPQLRLLRAHLPRPADGRRAGRGPRPVRARQRGLHADHRRAAPRRRHLSPRRRRLHRSAGLPARLAARRRRPVQRLPRRQRVARQRRRHRRRRRQGGLRLRAADDPLLPAAGRDPAEHRDLPAPRRRRIASTCSTTSSSWW